MLDWYVTDLPERDIHGDGGEIDAIEARLNDEACRYDASDRHRMPMTEGRDN